MCAGYWLFQQELRRQYWECARLLKKAFKTKNGRTVYDGGGITPDITIPSVLYSRPLIALVMNDEVNDYAMRLLQKHNSIASRTVQNDRCRIFRFCKVCRFKAIRHKKFSSGGIGTNDKVAKERICTILIKPNLRPSRRDYLWARSSY